MSILSKVLNYSSSATSLRKMSTRVASSLDPVQEALLEEQCILVDSMDRPMGSASKKVCHLVDPRTGQAPLHRAFSLFVFNQENRLLLQQRSDAKITFPGMWTNTCCSHPLANLTECVTADEARGVRLAAQRRIQAELGVPPSECPIDKMTYLTRIIYSAQSRGSEWGENEIDYILFLKSNVTVNPNFNEVKDLRYIGRDELDDFVRKVKEEGSGVTPWFDLIANSLLPNWWDKLMLDRLEEFKNHEEIYRFF